jgi:hypothetical protein
MYWRARAVHRAPDLRRRQRRRQAALHQRPRDPAVAQQRLLAPRRSRGAIRDRSPRHHEPLRPGQRWRHPFRRRPRLHLQTFVLRPLVLRWPAGRLHRCARRLLRRFRLPFDPSPIRLQGPCRCLLSRPRLMAMDAPRKSSRSIPVYQNLRWQSPIARPTSPPVAGPASARPAAPARRVGQLSRSNPPMPRLGSR